MAEHFCSSTNDPTQLVATKKVLASKGQVVDVSALPGVPTPPPQLFRHFRHSDAGLGCPELGAILKYDINIASHAMDYLTGTNGGLSHPYKPLLFVRHDLSNCSIITCRSGRYTTLTNGSVAVVTWRVKHFACCARRRAASAAIAS